MYGVIGEDRSDVDAIKNIIVRLAGDGVAVRGKGYSGCGELLKKGAAQLQVYERLKCSRFIVCYDSDGKDPAERKRALKQIFKDAGLKGVCCALVPVHEIEAWILADLPAVQNVIKGWAVAEGHKNPENQPHPKEYLEKLSEKNHRPRYAHATMNPQIAKHLNLEIVYQRCPSYRPLHDVVVKGVGNLGD
ncbi:DUF4276 family protein [Paraburkholderia adhaesiva]|uniref:DUF4276 family protein n=1 Tax=Paraburkholderia adhaesiva TaxID=2883244 RepID=UPI001F36BF13|nr:DUF4276 family protein [Paraburkholderia adhaesiva]